MMMELQEQNAEKHEQMLDLEDSNIDADML